ncbi:hypothetical protein [Bacterioplanoides sp.]|uniref:hypothetical protein n=1 Tax=Bacterioplanoides sp. TaxID=2066072 RepID=UPI003B5BC841
MKVNFESLIETLVGLHWGYKIFTLFFVTCSIIYIIFSSGKNCINPNNIEIDQINCKNFNDKTACDNLAKLGIGPDSAPPTLSKCGESIASAEALSDHIIKKKETPKGTWQGLEVRAENRCSVYDKKSTTHILKVLKTQ